MKVPYSWLKDYVDVKVDPKKLAYALTMAGVNVASCEKVGGEYILEFEITANRADCLSMLGIAREIAALYGKRVKIPRGLKKPAKSMRKMPLDIALKDTDLCLRYTARIIRNVEVKPSPDWLKERVISAGLRPVNNIVDITNFVLFETGQPTHAFDLDKIEGNIEVRPARSGERLITIDNTPRACAEDMLVIADESGPVAIAGVMGGLTTEVSKMTKNILLESAFFNPISVRRTSRSLGLSSESSYRFERRIDNDMVDRASERGTTLIEMIAGGEAGAYLDAGNKKTYSKTISYDIGKMNSLLGVSVGGTKAAKILKSLGFSVNAAKKKIKVTVPSFRGDVKTTVDLTEEVARIYGYEKIPATIPQVIGNTAIKDFIDVLEEKISGTLTQFGMNEVITYSLINKNNVKGFDIPEEEIVAIQNPLSIDQEIMRPTMLPGMLRVVSYNLNRKAERLSLFETGKIYRESKGLYKEEPVLSLGLAGVREDSWKNGAREFGFFDIKGIFERLLAEIGLSRIQFKRNTLAGFDRAASSAAEIGGETIARFGEIDRTLRERFGIEKPVY